MAAALPDKKIPWPLIIIFLVFSLSLMWSGFASYQHQKTRVEKETIASLETVANLKAQELAWWRRERLGDARVITANPSLARELQNLTKFPYNRSARQSLLDWLLTFQETFHYQSVRLLDAQGELILQAGITPESICPICKKLIQEVIQTPRIFFSDFHWDNKSNSFRCIIMAPVVPAGQTSLTGIIVLEINPHDFLFPMLQTWPTSSFQCRDGARPAGRG